MHKSELKALIQDCEADIRRGRADLVTRRLARVNARSLSRLPAQERLPLANLCRRAGLIRLGLKILVSPHALAEERLEYAALLMKNGSVDEAAEIVRELDGDRHPEAWLYRGFCHLMRWEFEPAIPLLRSYLKTGPADYAACVAEVNLASAMVAAAQWQEASSLLSERMVHFGRKGYSRLLGNCHELRSQINLQHGNLGAARTDLAQAETLLGAEVSSDQLFVLKWQAILLGLEKRDVGPLKAFRVRALERRHWESVREIDFFRLKIEPDAKEFDHLYFGTPYDSYRRRISTQLGRSPSDNFFLLGFAGGPVLDLAAGVVLGRDERPTEQVHRLLGVLLTDLYKPKNIGSLFATLFRGEHFDPFSSPNRVHQLLWRTREWLKEMDVPLVVEEQDGCFALKVNGECGILLPLVNSEINKEELLLAQFRANFGLRQVKTHVGARALGISSSSFRRWLRWAKLHGELTPPFAMNRRGSR